MNYWDFDIPLVKIQISETETRRLHLSSECTKTLGEQMEEHFKLKEFSKELLDPGWDIIEMYGEYYVSEYYVNDGIDSEEYGYEYHFNREIREKLPNSFFHTPLCDDSIIGYDAHSGAIIYDLWRAGQRLRRCIDDIYPAYDDSIYAIGHLLYQLEESGLDGKMPPIHILTPNFINYKPPKNTIYNSGDGILLFDYNGVKENYRKALKESIDCFKKVLKDHEAQRSKYVEYYQKQLEKLSKPYEVLGKGSQ